MKHFLAKLKCIFLPYILTAVNQPYEERIGSSPKWVLELFSAGLGLFLLILCYVRLKGW